MPCHWNVVWGRSGPDTRRSISGDALRAGAELISVVAVAENGVIGGAGSYDRFEPHVDRTVLSRIPGEYQGDSTFPDWDRDEWRLVDSTEYDEFTLVEWVRDAA